MYSVHYKTRTTVAIGYYSIQADKARSHQIELLTVCIRFVKNLTISVRFLTFTNVSASQNVEAKYQIIKNILSDLDIYTLPYISQSYDGASVMSGIYGGVQQFLKMIIHIVFIFIVYLID